MNKLTLLTLIYAIGIIIGALFLDVWGAETTLIKTMSIFIWTILFLIALFYVDKNEKKFYSEKDILELITLNFGSTFDNNNEIIQMVKVSVYIINR